MTLLEVITAVSDKIGPQSSWVWAVMAVLIFAGLIR